MDEEEDDGNKFTEKCKDCKVYMPKMDTYLTKCVYCKHLKENYMDKVDNFEPPEEEDDNDA